MRGSPCRVEQRRQQLLPHLGIYLHPAGRLPARPWPSQPPSLLPPVDLAPCLQARNRLDIFLPRKEWRRRGPRPTVIFITGGAWTIGYKGEVGWGQAEGAAGGWGAGAGCAGLPNCDREGRSCGSCRAACSAASLEEAGNSAFHFCCGHPARCLLCGRGPLPPHHSSLPHPTRIPTRTATTPAALAAWGALLGRRLSQRGVLVFCMDYRNFPQVAGGAVGAGTPSLSLFAGAPAWSSCGARASAAGVPSLVRCPASHRQAVCPTHPPTQHPHPPSS